MQPTWDVELMRAYKNTISQVCSVALDDLDVALADLKCQLAKNTIRPQHLLVESSTS